MRQLASVARTQVVAEHQTRDPGSQVSRITYCQFIHPVSVAGRHGSSINAWSADKHGTGAEAIALELASNGGAIMTLADGTRRKVYPTNIAFVSEAADEKKAAK